MVLVIVVGSVAAVFIIVLIFSIAIVTVITVDLEELGRYKNRRMEEVNGNGFLYTSHVRLRV